MSNSVLVDTRDMRKIAGANTAIASSVVALYNLADRLPAGPDADNLRREIGNILIQGMKIQDGVKSVIRENQ